MEVDLGMSIMKGGAVAPVGPLRLFGKKLSPRGAALSRGRCLNGGNGHRVDQS